MNLLLAAVARLTDRRPALAVVAVVVVTMVLGVFAAQQTTTTDMAAFAPATELAEANDRVDDTFGGVSGASVTVMVDAGPGGDVLGAQGLQAADAVRVAAEGAVADDLAPPPATTGDQAPPSSVASFATPVALALAAEGLDLADAPDEVVEATLVALLELPDVAPQVAALLSQDADVEASTARAGLVVVPLSATLDQEAQARAELALRDALADLDTGGLDVVPIGEMILADALLTDVEDDLAFLLGLAALLIVVILSLTFRRAGDVLLGLVGLAVTVVWTYGISVLLGPQYLGLTGELTQISMMIPVLLIGLAIDYAIHLVSRYREESLGGARPGRAAAAAVVSVGGALVLATVTTMIGFLTNLVSPLPPLRDFGVFVAVGVLSAFVVMVLLVPSVRVLVDRRRERKGRLRVPAPASGTVAGRVMGRAALLAERHAVTTLLVAAGVTAAATVAATQVSTSFSQDDFIPEDSEIGEVLTTFTDQFGGDVDETTFVLLDGDLERAEVMDALGEAQGAMADTPDVRIAAGQPQVSSPLTVLTELAAQPELAEGFAALGVTAEGVDPGADVAGALGLAREVAADAVAAVLTQDGTTGLVVVQSTAGQDRSFALADALTADLSAVRDTGVETTVTGEMLLYEETLEALTESQVLGIVLTLLAGLAVLVTFFWVRLRRPALGLVTMVPSVLVVAWVLGSMWVLGISLNVMTAMVASLAIGIGVPYGIHVTTRFTQDLQRTDDADEALRATVTHTGTALLGSAATTAAGFGVLAFASLVPMQQFGIITALTIVYSLLAAVLVEPACLKLWAAHHTRRALRGRRAEVQS